MIDFTNAKSITIPEGEVQMISKGEEILWQKQKYKTRLLYLESNKNQYIDTGVEPKTTVDYEFTGSINNNSTETGWIAGTPTWIGVHQKANTGVAICQSSTGQTYLNVNPNEVFSISLIGAEAYFNGVKTNTITRRNPTAGYTLFLFAYHHTNGTGSINSSIRMYGFKLWDNGVLIRDFIPVLDFDNVPCMYDLVNDKFYYNQGTTPFTYVEK